jgi:hypothetical protein
VQVALEEVTDLVGMAAVVHDLSDELTVICAYASLGGDVSYDVELTEGYFARIESAGKNAAQIARQLLVVDAAEPAAHDAVAATDSRPVASSFRQRLVAARG